jgi:hypothetical protein
MTPLNTGLVARLEALIGARRRQSGPTDTKAHCAHPRAIDFPHHKEINWGFPFHGVRALNEPSPCCCALTHPMPSRWNQAASPAGELVSIASL